MFKIKLIELNYMYFISDIYFQFTWLRITTRWALEDMVINTGVPVWEIF